MQMNFDGALSLKEEHKINEKRREEVVSCGGELRKERVQRSVRTFTVEGVIGQSDG